MKSKKQKCEPKMRNKKKWKPKTISKSHAKTIREKWKTKAKWLTLNG
jgi:hypothetical protein